MIYWSQTMMYHCFYSSHHPMSPLLWTLQVGELNLIFQILTHFYWLQDTWEKRISELFELKAPKNSSQATLKVNVAMLSFRRCELPIHFCNADTLSNPLPSQALLIHPPFHSVIIHSTHQKVKRKRQWKGTGEEGLCQSPVHFCFSQ